MGKNLSAYAKFAWGVLAYTVLVILWGAYVRASFSGDGCGRHWPTCQGALIPVPENTKMLVEFTHRLMSGLDFLLVLAMLIWALRAYPKGHLVRLGAGLAMAFMVIETLAGAALVLFQWVAYDTSVARAVVMAIHLLITLALLGALTVNAYWASGGPVARLRGQGPVGFALYLALGAVALLAASGAVTALGDTLFKAPSLIEGIKQDFSPTAHFLIRLRVFHPLIALSTGIYLLLVAGLVSHLRPHPTVRRYASLLVGLFALQLALGVLNLFLLAPIWMQILHLLVADLIWITLVLLVLSAFSEGVPRVEAGEGAQAAEAHAAKGKATLMDYIALTKPRVISLLLFTALAALFVAAGGWPGWKPFLAVLFGGYFAAGAANAINMVIDRDIDALMPRTARRPTVTQRISSRSALFFALFLELASFAILLWGGGLLSAMLALAGLVFYVFVYTLWLKRRTWRNIVIGGAAGAFPPLVGWAAATGELAPLAWVLFLVIFFWTPVHFWTLALLIKDEYARAGVPMLPVVAGARVTALQIALYALLTALLSLIPLTLGEAGLLYTLGAAALNAILLARAFALALHPEERPMARSLYLYSLAYLAALFLLMTLDRTLIA